MFNKLRHKILSPKGAAAAYDAPIQKRIQLLAQIRDLAAGIVQECSTLSKTFDYPEGPLHNTAECLSVGLKLLGQALKDKDEDYSKFLSELSVVYDEIGKAQRQFQRDLREQLIDPLNAWLLTDYKRMEGEINKLHERKREAEKAAERLAKPEPKREHLLLHEQSQKEYERQLDSVKMELLKLTTIKNEHAGLLCNLLALLKAYHASVRQIMESRGVDKWVAATV